MSDRWDGRDSTADIRRAAVKDGAFDGAGDDAPLWYWRARREFCAARGLPMPKFGTPIDVPAEPEDEPPVFAERQWERDGIAALRAALEARPPELAIDLVRLADKAFGRTVRVFAGVGCVFVSTFQQTYRVGGWEMPGFPKPGTRLVRCA